MFLHVPAFPLHVEHVDQEFIAVEEEAEAEDQEQQLQELEAVEQVEEQDPSLTLLTPTSSQASTGSF